MYYQAKEGMEKRCVCMFTSKGRTVRQLHSMFTHQLIKSVENGCVSLAGIERLRLEAGVSG